MIFQYVIKLAFWPLLLLSFFLFFRGHNQPGGGFIGGLVAAAGFALFAYAFGVQRMKQRMLVSPAVWVVAGLTMAYGSGFLGQIFGSEFLQGLWTSFEVPLLGQLGTPNLFDLGVYTVVIGMITLIVSELFEDIGEEEL